MKNIIIILSLIGLLSCNKSPTTINCTADFCSNALNLISKFDTIPTIDYSLLEMKDRIHEKVDSSIQPNNANTELLFNVLYDCDSANSFKLSLTYYFGEDNPTRLVTLPRFVLLLNTMGDVLFGPELIKLDSLENRIYNYYLNIGESNFPKTYHDIYFTLAWDDEIDNQLFSKFINQIISGYQMSVDYQSELLLNKQLCQLDKLELQSVAKQYPFRLFIADYETVDEFEIVNENDIVEEFDFDMSK